MQNWRCAHISLESWGFYTGCLIVSIFLCFKLIGNASRISHSAKFVAKSTYSTNGYFLFVLYNCCISCEYTPNSQYDFLILNKFIHCSMWWYGKWSKTIWQSELVEKRHSPVVYLLRQKVSTNRYSAWVICQDVNAALWSPNNTAYEAAIKCFKN